MASKSKQKRLAKQRRGFLRRNIRILLITATAAIVAAVAWRWYQSTKPYEPTAADWERANRATVIFQKELEFLANVPTLPSGIREKLHAAIRDNQSGKVEFNVDGLPHPKGNLVIMSADTSGPKPRIIVMAPRFLELHQIQPRDIFLSTLLTAFLHEYIHLDRWPQTKPPTEEEELDEEVRAYGKMCLEVVRPLRQVGASYLYDYARLDDILRNCGDNLQCPQFREAIKLYQEGKLVLPTGK